MADEPSIDEILASLDSLLEDADIGNDEPARDEPSREERAREQPESVSEAPDEGPKLQLTPPAPPPQIELTAEQLLEEPEAAEATGEAALAERGPALAAGEESEPLSPPVATPPSPAHNAPPSADSPAPAKDAPPEEADEARMDEALERVRAMLIERLPEALAPAVSGIVARVVRESVEEALAAMARGEKDGDKET